MVVLEGKLVGSGIPLSALLMQTRSSALLVVLVVADLPIIQQAVVEDIVGDRHQGQVLLVVGRAAAAGARTT